MRFRVSRGRLVYGFPIRGLGLSSRTETRRAPRAGTTALVSTLKVVGDDFRQGLSFGLIGSCCCSSGNAATGLGPPGMSGDVIHQVGLRSLACHGSLSN